MRVYFLKTVFRTIITDLTVVDNICIWNTWAG